MIISRTPLRISFFGGGTDLPVFYEKEFGCVISTSINRYIHLIGHKSFGGDYKVHYNKTEAVSSIDEIKNTRVREILKKADINNGFEIHSIGEVPHGTGLGSSSSFVVGLINLIKNLEMKSLTKEELANEACTVEMVDLKEPIGKQDQYAAAYGGLNFFQFNKDGTVDISPIKLSEGKKRELQKRIVIFYLDRTRNASEILQEQSNNITSKSDKFDALQKLKNIAIRMRDELNQDNIENFGKMLDESWKIKKSLASFISDSFIDNIYNTGISAGATGGKVLGAGGGGFILFYCEPEHQENLRKSLSTLKEFKVMFENDGSQIVYKFENGVD